MNDSEVARLVSRARIERTQFDPVQSRQVPLFLGNGHFGTCLGPLGLHQSAEEEAPLGHGRDLGQTVLMHRRHRRRGLAGIDYLLPVMKITWADPPLLPVDWEQVQDFYEGWVATRFSDSRGKVSVRSWMDPAPGHALAFDFEISGEARDLRVTALVKQTVHYGQNMVLPFKAGRGANGFRLDFWEGNSYFLESDGSFRLEGENFLLTLSPGRHRFVVTDGPDLPIPLEESRSRTRQFWQKLWQSTALMDFPQIEATRLAIRSTAYLHGSFPDDGSGFQAPPGGLSGNLWPFPFPQDLSFIHPALLDGGHLDMAKAWVEQYHRELPGMMAYTRRVYGKDGVHCPWVMPWDGVRDYLSPTPPNRFYYQIHNSAYLARMACETAEALGSETWKREVADPVVSAAAVFYASILVKGDNGRWRMAVTPAMGQDEHGESNASQYLCALESARYTLGLAVKMGLDPQGAWARILQDGLDLDALGKDERGIRFASDSKDNSLGKQKHPPQLNPLAFLPPSSAPEPELIQAYRHREDITVDAKRPLFFGWTLGAFLLASARMGDAEGFRRSWNQMELSGKVDPEWIQVHESSYGTDSHGVTRSRAASYFLTEHGMLLHALKETLVSEWWGRLHLAPCAAWEGTVRFRSIRTRTGLILSGEIAGSSYRIQVEATRRAKVQIGDKEISLNAGETAMLSR